MFWPCVCFFFQAVTQRCPPKWENIIDFNNLKIETPHTALKPTLWPLFQYITAHQILLVGFCGPVVDKESNYMT